MVKQPKTTSVISFYIGGTEKSFNVYKNIQNQMALFIACVT